MSTKHTPAPWEVMNHSDLATGDRYEGAYEVLAAVKGQYKANEKLIEAAPLLLEALELVRQQVRHDLECTTVTAKCGEVPQCTCGASEAASKAVKAIAKATGGAQ